MINNIIKGIIKRLVEEFGQDYEVYNQNIEQGLKEPCFCVLCVSPSQTQFLNKRYFKSNLFCVHYFPKSTNNAKCEINEVIERLFNCLEVIKVDEDLYRGQNLNAQVDDDVLSFFINYNAFIYKDNQDKILMQNYKHKTKINGG